MRRWPQGTPCIPVYLVYAGRRGHAAVDRELHTPCSWTGDSDRCRAAGIPEPTVFATKPDLARQVIERFLDAGHRAAWTGSTAYRLSKQALTLWTKQFAVDLMPRRIRANSVSPGPVTTPILKAFYDPADPDLLDGFRTSIGRRGTPDEIAEVVIFLLDKAGWINGADIVVDGAGEALLDVGALRPGEKDA
jgi:NAD(P)-dependent dehydrogenase (short-subunit alcohol dehydrogenase family)